MDTHILGLLFFLSANFCTSSQIPTELRQFERSNDLERLGLKVDVLIKDGVKNSSGIASAPHFVQVLCVKYALANKLFDGNNVLLPKSHICFQVLDSFAAAKVNFIVKERKRSLFRRAARRDIPPEPPLPNKQEKGKDSKNDTQQHLNGFLESPPDILDNDVYSAISRSPAGGRKGEHIPTGIEEMDGDSGTHHKPLGYPMSNQPTLTDTSDKSDVGMRGPPTKAISPPANAAGGKPSGDGRGGVANWVFITIGTSVVLVGLSIFLLSYMYRMRMAHSQPRGKEHSSKADVENADVLLSLDPPSCKAADQASHQAECIPMLNRSRGHHQDENFDCSGERSAPVCAGESPEREGLRFAAPRCLQSSPKEDTRRDRAESTGSIYKMVMNDGNKLRGGNVDFHRRYVDNPYVSDEIDVQPCVKKANRRPRKLEALQLNPPEQSKKAPNSDNGWNGSSASSTTSHHSARSYISIPPTSPSSNYIEAGSDRMSLLSTKSTSPVKMEWLTKSFSLDRKNEISTYQASTGVQTEDLVSPPTNKTVLGTPWQFGGAFAFKGGVLQARGSDVILSVPKGAVPRGQAIDIYGSIFTDTAHIRRKIEFPSEESLVTPVVEYLALPVNDFKRSLHLHLPHSLPAEFDTDSVKVYTFSVDERGGVTTSCIPFYGQSNLVGDQEAFWEKSQDENKIIITTSHFSGYFCTLCENTSLPSICTMVFGSHVQISPHRREIRVILYIWDRRLTIRDYLERFQKQESEVDRQLLTDMQVPLLNNASSDSRLVMRMEIMGGEEDRLCWRHVARPGGSRLLFKPLQVRRLSEIVQCCRHTDPVRVEWALENHPDVSPGPVFQCCIDILHTPESINDYEAALSEDMDDLMRTFYVRDLKVMSKQEDSESPAPFTFERATLKRTLSEALDLKQTEQMCFELGITSKDIGNFHKKFSSDAEVQCHLVEECLQRIGPEKFLSQLPIILDKLQLSHLLKGTGKEEPKQAPALNHGPQPKSVSAMTTGKKPEKEESSLTARKSIDSGVHHPSHTHIKTRNQDPDLRNTYSQYVDQPEKSEGVSGKSSFNNSVSRYGATAAPPSRASTYSSDLEGDQQHSTSNHSHHHHHNDDDHHHHHQAATNNKLDSSSGYASVNQHGDPQSSRSLSLTFCNNLQSIDNFSVVAHADTLEMPQSSVQPPPRPPVSQQHPSPSGEAYPEVTEELAVSTSGPKAFAGHMRGDPKDSNLHDSLEQTSKKELFGMHTVV